MSSAAAKVGNPLIKPPFQCDPAASGVIGAGDLPFTVPIEDSSAGVPASRASTMPFLYTIGLVRCLFAGISPPTLRGEYLDEFWAYSPGNFGRPGYVIKQPRVVVARLGFAGTEGRTELVFNALKAAAEPFGAAVVVGPNAVLVEQNGFLTSWAPRCFFRDSDGTIGTNFVPPETWAGGDVLVLDAIESPYTQGPEYFYTGAPDYQGGLRSDVLAAERPVFDAILDRIDRFTGVFFYDPSPPPPDPPPPPGQDIETIIPSDSVWAATTHGYPWSRRPVGGGDIGSYIGPMIAAINALWG